MLRGVVNAEDIEKRGREKRTVGNDLVRHPRHLLQVVLSSGGDALEEDLLSNTATESHAHAVDELLSRVEVTLLREVCGGKESQTEEGGRKGRKTTHTERNRERQHREER
jgi:hypothetical protein